MKLLKKEIKDNYINVYFSLDNEEYICCASLLNKFTYKQLLNMIEEKYNRKFEKINFKLPRLFKFYPKEVYKKWSEKRYRFITKYKIGFITYYKRTIRHGNKVKTTYSLIE